VVIAMASRNLPPGVQNKGIFWGTLGAVIFRVVLKFGEWLFSHVLKKVPHRHFVFSLPKILRRYFLYDRDLLSDLSRRAWEFLKVFFPAAVPERNPIPGAVIAIQTFGDLLGFNPPLPCLGNGGCCYAKGISGSLLPGPEKTEGNLPA
jgi:hypothetical protein